jgi:carbon starvation protein CstA
LIVFYYGHSKSPQATAANEIKGLETLTEITNPLFLLCTLVIPVWLVLGIADLLDKYQKPNYIRLSHVGVFFISIILFIVTLKIVQIQTSVEVLGWFWD